MHFSQTPIFLKHLVGMMVGNLALAQKIRQLMKQKSPSICLRELELSKEVERSEKTSWGKRAMNPGQQGQKFTLIIEPC